MGRSRKDFRIRNANGTRGKAGIKIDEDGTELAGGNMSGVTVGEGVSMQGEPGKGVQAMTSSMKKAFVRDMPFPLSLVPGPYSMPKQIPDVPFMPVLPYLPVAVAAAMMIIGITQSLSDEGDDGGGC